MTMPTIDGKLKEKLKSLKADIVHLHSPMPLGKFGLKFAQKRGIPVVSTFHSQFKQDFKKHAKLGFIVDLLLKSVVKVFSGCDRVFTMNPKSAEVLCSYGYKGEPAIVPNATDLVSPEDTNELQKTFKRGN
eukprot:gnl/Chilomastix_caulleri/2592.p1 GENE.gnl/Chilomastix_caulleri/2592~~gnl/Chilomastix_caulleri/2592.p1  ORF type:complete len:131 (+),score=26.21 gnl/Chilomastix_caulleri/2592:259-651(+)